MPYEPAESSCSEIHGITCVSNFLEHLASQESVAAFLEKMYSCIAPDGRIAVMGPNFRYCYREYFDFADHTVILTDKGVEEHLYAAGFELRSVDARFLPYTFTGRLPSHPFLTRAYLRLPLAWRLLGKQFLVIAERPGAQVTQSEIIGSRGEH